jgi:hypothetical protein
MIGKSKNSPNEASIPEIPVEQRIRPEPYANAMYILLFGRAPPLP